MNAAISINLTHVYRKTKEVIDLLYEREADFQSEDYPRYKKEIEKLGEVLGHLKTVEREFWP